jgi:hypothetical protein
LEQRRLLLHRIIALSLPKKHLIAALPAVLLPSTSTSSHPSSSPTRPRYKA